MGRGGTITMANGNIVQRLRRTADIGRIGNADGINLGEREQRPSP